ncbi:hypothetical protein SAMN05443667_107154 [Flavobacterium gillisiae]|uniref:Lipoprotein n=1 Tax=Flavobacterium gillisiae TaxID=150146 RepID=A0A1H4DBL0_9FLAO|nr:hypothetical protein [Flavobacterium gillisiae]SEA70101.1 hypothetical protein SAMN05443667_107154 [Flavobacterium gillisiae]
MKYLSLVILFLVLSCGNKEDILLPKSNVTVVADVKDHSPIYIFFRTNGKDTLAEVNRKNSIITTNWIFNIDKRLPLRLVIPEVMKLQDKKRNEKAHVNEKAENYYAYADSIGKNMAFIPFTKVYYKIEKPIGTIIYFDKNDEILIENNVIKREKIKEMCTTILPKKLADNFIFMFDKNMSYGMYIQNKIFIESLRLDSRNREEFVY